MAACAAHFFHFGKPEYLTHIHLEILCKVVSI